MECNDINIIIISLPGTAYIAFVRAVVAMRTLGMVDKVVLELERLSAQIACIARC